MKLSTNYTYLTSNKTKKIAEKIFEHKKKNTNTKLFVAHQEQVGRGVRPKPYIWRGILLLYKLKKYLDGQ